VRSVWCMSLRVHPLFPFPPLSPLLYLDSAPLVPYLLPPFFNPSRPAQHTLTPYPTASPPNGRTRSRYGALNVVAARRGGRDREEKDEVFAVVFAAKVCVACCCVLCHLRGGGGGVLRWVAWLEMCHVPPSSPVCVLVCVLWRRLWLHHCLTPR
jgi:hypothetical protein